MNKITVTLTEKSRQYLSELLYSLEMPTKKLEGELRLATKSDCINYCLEAMADFERETGEQLIGWLEEKFQTYSKPKADFVNRMMDVIEYNNAILMK